MPESQLERVILTQEQYANLSGFEMLYRSMEALLEPLCTQGESSLQALEWLIEDHDKAKEWRTVLERERKVIMGAHKTLELFYDVLRPLYRDDENPLDTFKRVVTERDGQKVILDGIRTAAGAGDHVSNEDLPQVVENLVAACARQEEWAKTCYSEFRKAEEAKEEIEEQLEEKLRLAEFNADQYQKVLINIQKERDKLVAKRDELAAHAIKLQKIICDAHDPFKTYLDAETALVGIIEERDRLKAELDALRRLVEKQDQSARDSAALLDTIAKLRNDAEEYTKIILEHEQTIAILNKSVSGFENGYKKELQSRRELEDGIEEALKGSQRDDESFLEAVVRLVKEYGERGEELSAAWDEVPTELINGKTMGECVAILVSGFNRKETEIAELEAKQEKLKTHARKLQLIISEAHDPFKTYLDAETALVGIIEERDRLKAELERRLEAFGHVKKALAQYTEPDPTSAWMTVLRLGQEKEQAEKQVQELAVKLSACETALAYAETERDMQRAEVDRLNTRFTEINNASSNLSKSLIESLEVAHLHCCNALGVLVPRGFRAAAYHVNIARERLEQAVFDGKDWDE